MSHLLPGAHQNRPQFSDGAGPPHTTHTILSWYQSWGGIPPSGETLHSMLEALPGGRFHAAHLYPVDYKMVGDLPRFLENYGIVTAKANMILDAWATTDAVRQGWSRSRSGASQHQAVRIYVLSAIEGQFCDGVGDYFRPAVQQGVKEFWGRPDVIVSRPPPQLLDWAVDIALRQSRVAIVIWCPWSYFVHGPQQRLLEFQNWHREQRIVLYSPAYTPTGCWLIVGRSPLRQQRPDQCTHRRLAVFSSDSARAGQGAGAATPVTLSWFAGGGVEAL